MGKRLQNEEIIAALIAEGTIKGAAASLKCTTRTLYDRMKKPEFDTLVEIRDDKEAPKQTRANCAVNILQYAARFTETTDIIERLEEVEKDLALSKNL